MIPSLAINHCLKKLHAAALLIRLHRPVGTLLLLWPTMWALWLAHDGSPPWLMVAVFIMGVVLMRSAGCAINDYADREIDGQVQRTAQRPLVAGLLSPREALVIAVLLALMAASLLFFLPLGVFPWALLAAVLATIYPFSKRWFAMPQFVLAVAFSCGIPMVFAAAGRPQDEMSALLCLANLVWTLGYDTLYAMVDKHDDLRQVEQRRSNALSAYYSSAMTFGDYDRYLVLACYAGFLALWALITVRLPNYWSVYAQVRVWPLWLIWSGVALGMLVHTYWLMTQNRGLFFRMFLQNHWFGAACWLGLVWVGLTVST